MYSIRSLQRAAFRLSKSTPSLAKPAFQSRSIQTQSLLSWQLRARSVASPFCSQRRWASTESDLEKELGEGQAESVESTGLDLKDDSAQIDAALRDAAAAEASQAQPPPAKAETDTNNSIADVAAANAPQQAGGHFSERRSPAFANSPKETVYIGNLFFDVTDVDLKHEFGKYGGIKRARIITDPRGLSKGFGYIEFDSIAAAQAAIANMDTQLFEGRRVTVQFAQQNMSTLAAANEAMRDSPRNPPSKTLFIGNMSFEMTDRDLNNLFKDVQNVVDVRVAIDRRTGQPRGFAHADFIDVTSAQNAYQSLAGKEVHGRKLRVDYSAVGGVNRARREDRASR